jgi:hypothetical protein
MNNLFAADSFGIQLTPGRFYMNQARFQEVTHPGSKGLNPDKADHRTFEVVLYLSGNHVNRTLSGWLSFLRESDQVDFCLQVTGHLTS